MTAALVRALRWLPLALVLGLLAFAISSPFVNMLLWAVADKGHFPHKPALGATPLYAFLTVTLPLAGPGIIASAIFVFLGALDEFTGTYFVPDVTTLPLLLFRASMEGNYQIAAITALILLVPSVEFVLLIERFLRADVLAKVGS